MRWQSEAISRAALPLAFAAVVLGTLSLLFAKVHSGIGEFDEGFVATGAMLIRQGVWPIRDFFSLYGPAQYALTAFAFAVFGEDLWVSRNLHLLVLALIGVASVLAAAHLQPRQRWICVLVACAWLLFTRRANPPPGYGAVTATLSMLAAAGALAWAFKAAAPAPARCRLLLCSLLVGMTTLLRWDFGIYSGLALVAAWLFGARPHHPLSRPVALAWLLGPGLAVALAGLVPLIVAGGAQRWFAEAVLFYLRGFEQWRGIVLVGPSLDLALEAWASRDRWTVARAALTLVYLSAPPLVAGGVLAWQLRKRWMGCPVHSSDVLAVAVALSVLLTFNQLRVRPGWIQGYPTFTLALPLLACMAGGAWQTWRLQWRSASVGVGLLPLVLLPAYVAYADMRPGWPAPAQPALARAHGALLGTPYAAAAWADYVALIAHVQRNSAPGEPIFSGVTDTSRLFVNDAMVYFLAARPAATRWVEMEPGQTNSERGQADLIQELERHRVRVLVLWDKRSVERNATGSSNGVMLFDRFVQQQFKLQRRFGAYSVMIRAAP